MRDCHLLLSNIISLQLARFSRVFVVASGKFSSKATEYSSAELSWALGSICALRQQPFAAELLEREFPPPHSETTLIRAGRALGLKVKQVRIKPASLKRMVFPLLVGLKSGEAVRPPPERHLTLVSFPRLLTITLCCSAPAATLP
jgi:hypothetical protein